MLLAEKIAKLRKANGWSQEELAMKLDISRQSVSKWESASSIPDLDKILKLSELFGVSTDYLLKDEIEEFVVSEEMEEDGSLTEKCVYRNISMDKANEYLEMTRTCAWKIALGVSACILSPVLLIFLGALSEEKQTGITEEMAGGIGVIILLLIVAAAVADFIMTGLKLGKYEYLEKENITLDYGMADRIESSRENFEPVFRKSITAGVVLCIVSVIPLLLAGALEKPDLVLAVCVDILLIIVACGVFLLVWAAMIYGSYQKLLEEGDYTREKKMVKKYHDTLSGVYWCIVTAIYLGISFYTGKWEITWAIWACAGVLYAAVCGLVGLIRKQ